MDKKNIENIFPLSPMQQGILFHTLLAPNSEIYIPQVYLSLEGDLNIPFLKEAWQQVIVRHQPLRATFHWESWEKSFQVIHRQANLPWEELNWQEFTSDKQEKLLEDFLKQDRQQTFNLKKPPLIRINLIKLAENKCLLIWTQHHLILDGWSSGLVIKEVFAICKALEKNQDISLPYTYPYGEYIAWLQKQNISTAQQFWQKQLKDFTTPTAWRVEKNSDKIPSQAQQDEQQLSLSSTTTTALKSLVQQHQLTLNTFIQGIFALLLSRYSDEEDVVFGATSSGRPASLPRVESMVGLFINTLPVRIYVPPQEWLIPWLQKLQVQQAEALQYEFTPLVKIQEWSDLPPGISLFESILVFENYPIDPSLLKPEENLKISEVKSIEWTSFPLTVLVGVGSELSIKIKYSCDRFDDSTITRLSNHFRTLLEGAITNPQQRLGELPLLSEAERQQMLVHWNNTRAGYPKHQCIHQLFEAQVERTPDAIAIVFENQSLTFQELNSKANQLAHYLKTLGVAPENRVGICAERSLLMVVGILGILKAGGAYVPIDPFYPQERLTFILKDAQVAFLLVQERFLRILPSKPAKVIGLETWTDMAQQPRSNPISGANSNNTLYIIYTSGSTGTPKGVINTHRGVANRLLWMQDIYKLNQSDRVLQKTPFSFDVSVWEFFWPLITGASLIIAKPEGHQDSAYLVELIAQQQITTIHFVPSLLQVFLEESGIERCSKLKRVICSGEALPIKLQQHFFARLNTVELHNLYGPTEAAIDVTAWTCQKGNSFPASIVPIGRPIANTQIYLLDSHERLVPIGVPGEIHIGGEGLARGYYNRPDLTAEKFIPNPFSKSGDRLYKTGDLARYLSDGNIEFLGRLDYQVKIRGLRIELGEIEAVLEKHPDVLTCVVIAREDYLENKRLVAYVIPKVKQQDFEGLLRRFLEKKLPNYMVPATVIIDEFPLTPNGKLNRKALPAPDAREAMRQSNVPPRNSLEEKIAALWRDTLKIEKIGIHENFFELGGNSLLATRINSRLREAFQMDLPLRTLFEKPTIAELAERIQTMQMTRQQLSRPPVTQGGDRKEIEI